MAADLPLIRTYPPGGLAKAASKPDARGYRVGFPEFQSARGAFARTDVAVCDDTRVALGMTKQDVRNTLTLCCRVSTPVLIDQEQSGWLAFKPKRERQALCEGAVSFDVTGKLVYAKREPGTYRGNDDGLGFTGSLFKIVSDFLPQSVKIDLYGTSRIGAAQIQLNVRSGPKGSSSTLRIVINDRIARIQLLEYGVQNDVIVSEEIGDFTKTDLTMVPITKK